MHPVDYTDTVAQHVATAITRQPRLLLIHEPGPTGSNKLASCHQQALQEHSPATTGVVLEQAKDHYCRRTHPTSVHRIT